jgi:hypothetical protein
VLSAWEVSSAIRGLPAKTLICSTLTRLATNDREHPGKSWTFLQRTDDLRITSVSHALLAGVKARASFRFTSCCWRQSLAVFGGAAGHPGLVNPILAGALGGRHRRALGWSAHPAA